MFTVGWKNSTISETPTKTKNVNIVKNLIFGKTLISFIKATKAQTKKIVEIKYGIICPYSITYLPSSEIE